MFNIENRSLFIFEGLSSAQRAALEPIFESLECECDQVIFNQGEASAYLFIVLEGNVAVRFKPDDGPELTVAKIKPGGVFGWSAAFGGDTYTSGAICTENAKLLRVRGSDLKTLCDEYPETGIMVLDRLATVVAERLRSTHKQVVALLKHGLKNGVKPIGG